MVDLSLVGCLVRVRGGARRRARSSTSGSSSPDGPLEAKARVAGASIDGDSLPGPARQFLAGLEFLALAAADELRLRTFLEAEAKRRRGAHTPPP